MKKVRNKMAINSNGNKTNKKVFDVAKPGKTTANASSKPVIVGHKPMMKDPMVKDEEVSELAEDAKTAPVLSDDTDDKESLASAKQNEPSNANIQAPSATKITIKPLSEEEIEENSDKSDKPESADNRPAEFEEPAPEKEKIEPEATEDKVEKGDSSKPAESEEKFEEAGTGDEGEKTDNNHEDSDDEKENEGDADNEGDGTKDSATGALGAVAAQAGKKKSKKEEEAEKEKHEHLEKLVRDKKYFAPIGVKTRRRFMRSLLITTVLILLVTTAVLYLLIDANIIDLGVKLPYSLINP